MTNLLLIVIIIQLALLVDTLGLRTPRNVYLAFKEFLANHKGNTKS